MATGKTENYNRYTMVLRAGVVNLWRPELLFETTEYYNHPLYIDALQEIVQPHDISLLKFPQAITFSARVQPIRLQRDADKNRNYDGVRLEASGWGRTWTNGASPENLQWVYLRGVSNLACWFSYGGSSTIVDSTICANYYNVTSQSTCQGDSGGPLVDLEEDGKYTMVGISSFVARAGCHVGDFPAGFIRPGHYHDWYRQVTGINFDWEHGEPPSESSSSESSSSESISEESAESSEEVNPEPEPDTEEEIAPEPETEESEEAAPEPETEEEVAPEPESEESEEVAPEPETEEEIAPEPETEEVSEEDAPEPETEEEVAPEPESEESQEVVPEPEKAPEPEVSEEVAPEPESEEVVPQPEPESEEAAPEPETEEEIAPEPETEETSEEVAPEVESDNEGDNENPEETRFGFPTMAKFFFQ